MATVTGLTAARMMDIENQSIVDGTVDVNGNLILTQFDGTPITAGPVIGPTGATGAQGAPGVAGVSSIPGEIKMWPNSILPDQGGYGKWVWADGGIYVAATYPIASGHINAAWKTAHGQSDPGAGNFRVPDLRGLVPAGLDQMPGGARANRMTRAVAILIAGKSGTETHLISVAEMPSHNHGGSVSISGGTSGGGGHSHTFTGGTLLQNTFGTPGGGSAYSGAYTLGTSVGGDHSHSFSGSGGIASQGSGGGHENVQPTVFVPYIVRLDG